MTANTSRRKFLKAAVMGGVGASLAGEDLNVTVCNPLLRTPLSLIIDDSCPVINLGYYWILHRHQWRLRHAPDTPPSGWERHYDKLDRMPNTIPAAFAAKWGEWCGEQGIRGKFSMVPFPAGVGRIDRGFDGFPKSEWRDWLRVTKEIIHPNFDLTPEMLTHTAVVDLKTWQLTEAWEQVEWVDPPVEPLTDYIAAAMQLLKNVGIACEGVTSPGAFGKKKESAYARAVLDAAWRVNRNPRPFYFLHIKTKAEEMPDVPLWHVDKVAGRAIASIVGCTGDWFGATGYDPENPDLFITQDLRGGRLPPVLEKELPCILLGHWPCFYANDQIGFKVLKEVKRRLDAYDPDRTKTIWMKNSEIGHYWMARMLSDIEVESPNRFRIQTRFPTRHFTLAVRLTAKQVRVNARELHRVGSRHDFRGGTFLVEGRRTFLAFDLAMGKTTLTLVREES